MCLARFGYDLKGVPRSTNSAAAYGSVMHNSLQILERMIHEGRVMYPDPRDPRMMEVIRQAVDVAVRNFLHYWLPANIEAICEPVPADGWLPRQGFNELRAKGVEVIKKYADLIRFDDHELLALEYGFLVPIDGTWDDELGEPHMLAGSIDRLAVRHFSRKPAVAVDDYKTGKEQRYLRHNAQFTGYCYATTKREFWVGHRGEDGFGEERGEQLYQRFQNAARRGTWINLRSVETKDAGYRAERDYDRFALAITQLHATIQADVFPLTLKGEACQYCEFRNSCGGMGVADDDEGNPNRRVA